MDKKIIDKKILLVIIVIILLGGGIFAWYQFRTAKDPVIYPVIDPIVDPLINQEQEIVAPRAVLRGNRKLTSLLPLDIRQGHIATYNVFYQDKIVGEATWSRIEENKIKTVSAINIPELYQEETTGIITHSFDLKPKSAESDSIVKAMGQSMEMKSNVIVDYNANLVNTTIEINGNVSPSISDVINPNTVTEINIQELYIGWEVGDVKVVDKTTVIVPAGTFDVFVIEISGTVIGAEGKNVYYVTSTGKMIKSSVLILGFEFPIITKLKSYLPK